MILHSYIVSQLHGHTIHIYIYIHQMYSKSYETVFSFTVNTLNWLKNLGCAMCSRSVKAPPESSSVARIRWPSSETFQRPHVAFRVTDSNTFKYFKSCRTCASSHLEESLPNPSHRSNPSSFKSVTALQQKKHHRFRSLRFHILKFPGVVQQWRSLSHTTQCFGLLMSTRPRPSIWHKDILDSAATANAYLSVWFANSRVTGASTAWTA